uniref:protein FAR1-RELATED SEQUENCE 5-like n=1 Tax=Erigeron canadensis TaxID=72917 RepID=UPI001CB9B074|nr:protein FAR1-RELATED SEQUENCE 5-like [Erigeron canadensis]
METNQNANVDEDVDSTANNAPAESSSFSISNTNLYTSRTEELYDDDSCTPIVDDYLKPVKGTIFKTIEEAIQMYEKYAYEAGFDTKLSTQRRLKSGKVKTKYIWCSKSGKSQDVSMDTLNSEERERRSSTMVTGCKAHVFFKIVEHNGKYALIEFVEKHNHKMNAGEYRYLSKKHRKLGISEINFIQKVSTSDIGPTRAHHIYSNLVGSQKNTHGTVVNFKNHKMTITCLIGSDDSQMLINKMNNRKDCVPGFFFKYKVNNNELAGLFWADEIARQNYIEFGDIISFDATYRTNRYNMIFVPFTAIDNHKKKVSIGARMIINETAESYEWLLRAFLGAFVEQPRMVVTDQDVSMKKAVATVFSDSRHRLCFQVVHTDNISVGSRRDKQCLYNCSQISVSNEGSNEVIIIKENREINKKPEKKPPRNKKRKEYEDEDEDIVEDIVTVHEEDPEDGIEESTKNAKRHTACTS